MNVGDIFKRLGKFTTDNSPSILTAIAVAGVASTAYLTAKGTIKAVVLIERERQKRNDPVFTKTTKADAFKWAWKAYIPAAGSATATVICINMANRSGNRRAAALAAAYALSERAWTEYKDKVVEKLGEKKEQEVRDEVAQDRITKSSNLGDVIVVGEGSVLCHEAFTGRYFLSDMEELKRAQNNVNYKINNDYYASLTDFYNEIDGLERTSFSDEVGWNSDELLEIIFSTVLTKSGKPCLSMDFRVKPIRDFYKVN
jgi:hypothetical protein